ncbi:LysR family transcriptional regulator [Alicyclobacillus cycloheptanicus]|uniref:DNA-binding transcriptional LysR family regulator n=1 Tax=Alicyclobacillus cycloheptanicus TaxID=1457 RepID=A0ABT9XIJ4_9BACL|nr:LysR family transcriptional regulator [Alicyclobacillus cycloheptanicus]MDQ0190022.1 DNA-binding transcriptional LysR family regulator [Alicyclobacillus cycloheptanicus]WDM00076.1 LysR family transcriptional regulator [Alicyclobacillus cycloheptanicus]
METKDIALFLAIARIGSISRTAEQLFMSQSTVTTRLQRLEHALGYPLFVRLQSGVQLTPEGERFVPLAERMTALEAEMTQQAGTDTPVLRVMSGRAFVSTDVPACLSRMLKNANVRLEVRMGMYSEMLDALLADQVDFCFIGEPVFHPHIKKIEFPQDAIDLIVPAGHHFVHNFPGIRGLHKAPFIAFARDDAPFRKRVMRLLAEQDVYPLIRMELDSIDGIKAMVGHGLGMSCLPRRTLYDADEKGYVRIPIAAPGWTRPTFLAFRESAADKPIGKQFIAVVTEYYQQLTV